jgi:hypothetical protein
MSACLSIVLINRIYMERHDRASIASTWSDTTGLCSDTVETVLEVHNSGESTCQVPRNEWVIAFYDQGATASEEEYEDARCSRTR